MTTTRALIEQIVQSFDALVIEWSPLNEHRVEVVSGLRSILLATILPPEAPSPDRERVALASAMTFDMWWAKFLFEEAPPKTAAMAAWHAARSHGQPDPCNPFLTAPIEREGFVLVPVDPGTCELDDSGFLLAFMSALHSNLGDDAPTGWSDFSDMQRARIKAAWRAMISAAPVLSGRGETGWRDIASAPKDEWLWVFCKHADPEDGPMLRAKHTNGGSSYGWYWHDSGGHELNAEPTAWQPLPAPPAKPSGVGDD